MLALGIGANTAIYTLVDVVVRRSLSITRPDEVYRLRNTSDCCVNGGLRPEFSLFSYSLYRYFTEHTPEAAGITGFQARPILFGVRRAGSSAAAAVRPFRTSWGSSAS